MQTLNRALSSQQALILRLAVGAIFGLIIASLNIDKVASQPLPQPVIWRETLSFTLILLAFVIWAGAGAMRIISLAVWSLIAFLMVGYMTWFPNMETSNGFNWQGHTFLLFPLLFIAHELVSSGDQAGKWIAPYETYFDEAWKRGVQLALAILFTALFWGILWLGAALLGFIGFDWLKELLQNRYFSWPMTGLAFGAAVHLGDVQTKLLANVRNLVLGVLAWLLPVITLIGAIFAASLLVSGLAPLWATKAATATLLSGCIGFVLLINAAYQQGDSERAVPLVLKLCVRAGGLLLLVFAALAAWSLALRIGQYGLSSDRILAGLGVIIALAYGIGYSVAVFVPGRWMRLLEPMNIGLAIFKCVLFIAILTPIATPNRLSVNDQVARLTSGKVSVAKFDWWLLKDDTGSYGKKALETLAKSTTTAIATKAKAALDDKIGERPFENTILDSPPGPTRADIEAIPIVFPGGARLPETFVSMNFTVDRPGFLPAPTCLRSATPEAQDASCKGALLDLNNDGVAEILIRSGPSLFVYTYANNKWTSNNEYIDISGREADFDAGKMRAVPSFWNDLMIGDKRTAVSKLEPNAPANVLTDVAPETPSSK